MKHVASPPRCAELFRDGYTDLCQFTLEKRTGNHEPLWAARNRIRNCTRAFDF
jgi:hypothetical protein